MSVELRVDGLGARVKRRGRVEVDPARTAERYRWVAQLRSEAAQLREDIALEEGANEAKP